MPDVLSQNEVDALLAAVSATGGGRRATDSGVRYYDFLRPERASASTMRALADLHEAAARGIAEALSGALGSPVECRLQSFDQIAWGEFLMGLPSPTCFAVVEARPPGGRLAVEIGPQVVFPMIERLLGAPDDAEPEVPARALSAIERRVASTAAEIIAGSLASLWRRAREVEAAVVQFESNPQLAQVAPPAEMAALATFEITLRRASGLAHVAMPFGAFGELLAEIAAASERVEPRSGDVNADAAAVRRALACVPVRVEATAVTMRVKLRDVVGLSAGSVLQTSRREGDDVIVTIGGKPKFRATEGTLRGHRAFRVGAPTPAAPADRPAGDEAGAAASEGES